MSDWTLLNREIATAGELPKMEKVSFQRPSLYHLQNCPNNSSAPSWLPEAQRLRDVRPKAGESGNNPPIQSALRMSIILRSWGAFWIFGPAHPRA